jgi:ubiquinone/menaquinone biosynthesis C-methylase UbiE
MNNNTEQKLLDIVSKNYDEIAEEFHQTRRKPLWAPVVKLTAEIKDGDIVIDIGCGNGRLREVLKNINITYIGVDASQNLLTLAEQNESFRLINQRFILGNILSLDQLKLPPADHVFCLAVLHHLPGNYLQAKGLNQLLTICKPNGRIVFSAWRLWTNWQMLSNRHYRIAKLITNSFFKKLFGLSELDFGDLLFQWGKNNNRWRYYHAFTKKGLLRLCQKTHAQNINIIYDNYNYYCVLKNSNSVK